MSEPTLFFDQEACKSIITRELAILAPAIRSHGGDVEFVAFDGIRVTIRLKGACVGCPISSYTVKDGILKHLQCHIPMLKEVIAIFE